MTADEARREEIRIMSLPGMQEKFSQFSKDWHDNDLVSCKDGHRSEETYFRHSQRCSCEPSWLPLSIDRDNPERGLWGMVDWRQWEGSININNGKLRLIVRQSLDYKFIEATPTLALLQALARQIGEEVE